MTFEAKPKVTTSLRSVLVEIVLSVLVAVVVFGAIQWWQGRDYSGGIAAGEKAPDFELVDVQSGETVSLSSLQGRPVLLNFWATWCGPCRSEMPALERLKRQAPSGLQVVSVTADEPQIVRRFLANGGYTFACLMDASAEVSERYRVATLPRTLLLDEQGRVIWDHNGALERGAVEASLSELSP